MKIEHFTPPLPKKAAMTAIAANALGVESFSIELRNNPRAMPAGLKAVMDYCQAMPATGHGSSVYQDWLKHRHD